MVVNFYCPKCNTFSPGSWRKCAQCSQPFEGETIQYKKTTLVLARKRKICRGIINSILGSLIFWACIGLFQTKIGFISVFLLVLFFLEYAPQIILWAKKKVFVHIV